MTNAPGGQDHPGTDSFFDSLRRIDLRRGSDRWIGGVSSGIAQRFGLDPLVVRVAFVVASVFFGFGIAVYLWAWLLVPDLSDRTHLEQGLREGRGESILLLVVTALATIGILPWWGGPGGYWDSGWWFGSALLTVAVVVGVIYLLRSTGVVGPGGPCTGGGGPQPGGNPPPPPGGTTGYAGAPGHGGTGTSSYGWAGQGATAGTQSRPPGAPSRQQPVTHPRPVQERRKTGGVVVGLIATGLTMLTFGALLWAGMEHGLPGNDLAVALAGALAILGLVVLVVGAAGRHSGWPGFLAALLLVGTVTVAPLPDDYDVSTRVGQDVWRPTTVSEDTRFALGAGEGVLDLRRVDPADLDGQTIRVDVNVGHLRVLVPEDLTVRVDAGSGIGTVNLNGLDRESGGSMSVSGGLNVTEDLVVGDGPVDLVIDARVGIGQVSVERN